MDPEPEYQESIAITFEWTLRGLKNLFESTKGEAKSKVTKSIKFGGGRWQILFYANAGTSVKESGTEGAFVSLYLSCEPTTEEKEAALADSGRWVREGVYKFSFELRNVGKSVLYNIKEAHNHSFLHKTANWGWAQFARRDHVYHQASAVKAQDAFVIVCTISSSPSTPIPPSSVPRQSVPKGLLDTVGALLDDSLYSDVEFVIPRRGQALNQARRIRASCRLLKRADYFEAMFSPNFAEGSIEGSSSLHVSESPATPSVIGSELGFVLNEFDDSDDDDGEIAHDSQSSTDPDNSLQFACTSEPLATPLPDNMEDIDAERQAQQNVQTKSQLSHPSSPRSSRTESLDLPSRQLQHVSSPRMTVVVKDVAYNTYFATLYYIYTDTIVFAPLSSSFISSRGPSPPTPTVGLPSTLSESQGQISFHRRSIQQETPATRKEWIRDWQNNNPGRPAPCSAKAVYKLADRLDLRELKERASQHIFKSLTVDNIAYEVFSPFAAAFDDIRKVQVNFFLTHWQDIRSSESMRNVWQQIRNGRHPGFEEVWPVIASSLEFRPSARNISGTS